MAEVIEKGQLVQLINRIEKLEQEKAKIAEDIKEVYDEAKGSGFDTKIMRQVIRLMKLDKNKLAEQEEILNLYRDALEV